MMATKLLKRRIGVLPVVILGTLLMSGCIEQEIEQIKEKDHNNHYHD